MSSRVGLVGCGRWGSLILRDLRSLGCEVPVVARSPESRERAADGGAAEIVESIGALAGVAGVVVATPEDSHAAVNAAALELGVPVFSEKPLTVDPSSAAELAASAPDRLFCMDKWRYHPGVEALGELARSGELGEPLGLRCRRLGWGNAHPTSDTTWHLAPHDLSIALEIFGALPEPRFAVFEGPAADPRGISGVLGERPLVEIEVSAARHVRERSVQLDCSDGVAWLPDPMAEAIGVARSSAIGDEPELRPISTEMPLLRELQAFVTHLEGGPPPRSSAAEAAAIVAALGELRVLAGLPRASAEAGLDR
jgi:predicted dehydrogenase